MSYSLDLSKRGIEWGENGATRATSAKIYRVGRATIYRSINREDLRPTHVKRRKRKLDWEALRKDVEENPDKKLAQRAEKFGLRPSAICYALKEMKITRKKKNYLIEKETHNRKLKIIRVVSPCANLRGNIVFTERALTNTS